VRPQAAWSRVTGALGLRVTQLQRGRGLGTEQLSFISITADVIVPVKRGGIRAADHGAGAGRQGHSGRVVGPLSGRPPRAGRSTALQAGSEVAA
jgi:hypothetical protein